MYILYVRIYTCVCKCVCVCVLSSCNNHNGFMTTGELGHTHPCTYPVFSSTFQPYQALPLFSMLYFGALFLDGGSPFKILPSLRKKVPKISYSVTQNEFVTTRLL